MLIKISLFSRFYCLNNKLRFRKFKLRGKNALRRLFPTYFALAPKRLVTPASDGQKRDGPLWDVHILKNNIHFKQLPL